MIKNNFKKKLENKMKIDLKYEKNHNLEKIWQKTGKKWKELRKNN